MKNKIQENGGFSFVETIISISILVLFLGALATLYAKYSKYYNIQQVEVKVGDTASEAMKELKDASLQADKIVSSHTFSGQTYTTGQHVLVLEIPSIDSSGNVIDSKYDYEAFYTSGSNLYRLVQADASSSRPSGTNKISDSVSAINFTYNNVNLGLATEIDTILQMQATSGGKTISYSLHEEMYLRNK